MSETDAGSPVADPIGMDAIDSSKYEKAKKQNQETKRRITLRERLIVNNFSF
jgi:hypothetical protein